MKKYSTAEHNLTSEEKSFSRLDRHSKKQARQLCDLKKGKQSRWQTRQED